MAQSYYVVIDNPFFIIFNDKVFVIKEEKVLCLVLCLVCPEKRHDMYSKVNSSYL